MSAFAADASVTLAWYLAEEFSPSAREWQDRLLAGTVRLIVPCLHYWEFANALRTLVNRREFEESLAREVRDLHLEARLDVNEPDRREVLKVALEFGATVYDAVFIALAIARGVPLVTAERATTAWVTKLGKRVRAVR